MTLLGNTLESWVTAFGVSAAMFVVLVTVRNLLVRYLGAIARRTATTVDDLAVSLLGSTSWVVIAAAALVVGKEFLTLRPVIGRIMNTVLLLSLVGQGVVWGGRVIRYWVDEALRSRMSTDASTSGTVTAIAFGAKVVLWSVAALLTLDNLGVNITTLVAGLGIGGIAVALAVQNILGDLFASLSIILDRPFVPGDFIVVGDMLGTIDHIGLRTTRIRSLSGEEIVFSNNELIRSRIRNFRKLLERRVVFTLGVTYDTPMERLRSIGPAIGSIIRSAGPTRLDRVHLKEFGASAMIYEVVYFVLDPDFTRFMDVQEAINFGVLEYFRSNRISFAYPTMTIVHESAGVPESPEALPPPVGAPTPFIGRPDVAARADLRVTDRL
jgi:small-conductance mechanosensitive channel